MQISPINNINIKEKNLTRRNTTSPLNPCNNKENQIQQLTNIYYPVFRNSATAVTTKTISKTEEPQRKHSSVYPSLYEHPSKFKLNRFDNLPCPACGNTMMSKQLYKDFQKRLEETEPSNYLYLLGEYRDYMRPIEGSVYDELVKNASTMETNDIRTILTTMRKERLSHLQRIQKRKLTQMKKVVKNLPTDERKALNEKLIELGKQIKSKNEESSFRRKRMIYELQELQISDPVVREKLLEYANAFPTSTDTNVAWIVKYSGKNKFNQDWTSKEIAERMLSNSVSNTDHILAYSIERNHDDITNYMSMHCGCNSTKGNKTFMQWYNEPIGTREDTLNAYFKKAYELISSGKVADPKYQYYVAHATRTIEDISKGFVQLECDDKTPDEILEIDKTKQLPIYHKAKKGTDN